MLFNSIPFIFYFLPVVAAGYAVLAWGRRQALVFVWLTIVSFFFYAYWNPPYLALLLVSIGVNYGFGRALMERPSNRLLALGVIFNLGLIGYFKYADFFVATVNTAWDTALPMPETVLPLAISFFTFQQIAYLVDVRQGKVRDTNFAHYALFVSFFPQLIAGPIVHHSEIIPQFVRRERGFRFDDVIAGGAIFIIGLQKKVVIADGIAVYADAVFADATGQPPALVAAWVGAMAYTFQLYFDFSGYSDMAIGLARMFSIRLPENFASPYKAVNIIEFWRRWHMTLSRFLRDYLYYPLGGNRRGQPRRFANVMITMLLGGLWHGAGWTFVFWGGLHGFYLAVNHGWRALRRKLGHDLTHSTPLGRALSRTVTLLAVVVGWVFFRAESFSDAATILAGMSGLNGMEPANSSGTALAWLLALLGIVLFAPNTRQLMDGISAEGEAAPALVRAWLYPAVGVFGAVGLLIILARGTTTNDFIYMVF